LVRQTCPHNISISEWKAMTQPQYDSGPVDDAGAGDWPEPAQPGPLATIGAWGTIVGPVAWLLWSTVSILMK
jgi:hypothetical protein